MFNMTLIALRYLSGQKLRTALTVLAIMFGVGVIFGTATLLPSLETSLARFGTPAGQTDLQVKLVSGQAFDATQPLVTLRAIDGVKAATASLRRTFTLPVSTVAEDQRPQIEMVGVDPLEAQQVTSYPMKEGRFLQPDDKGKTVIPASIASLANLHVGQAFPLLTPGGLQFYTVVGLLADQGTLGRPQIFVTLGDAQAAFREPGKTNTLDVALVPGVDRAAMKTRVLQTLGQDFGVKQGSGFDFAIGYATLYFFGMLALFVGGFLVFNTFRTVVIERQRDLSILRAIGAENTQIIRLVLVESLLQGIVGTLLGLVAGYGLAYIGLQWNALTSMIGGATKLGNAPQLYVQLPAIVVSIVLGIGTSLVAGYLPARAAGRVSPLAALRPSTPDESKRVAVGAIVASSLAILVAVVMFAAGGQMVMAGGFVLLLGAVGFVPVLIAPIVRLFNPAFLQIFPREAELARGNLLRQVGRSAVIVNSLMVAYAVFVASVILVASLADFIRRVDTQYFMSDVVLVPAGNGSGSADNAVINSAMGTDESLAAKINALPEVQQVTSLRLVHDLYKNQPITLLGIEPQYINKLRPLNIEQGDPAQLSTRRTVVINQKMVSVFGLRVGDTLQLNTSAAGQQPYQIVGVGEDFNLDPDQLGLIVSQANLAQDYGNQEDVMVYITLQPGVSYETAQQAIRVLTKDYPQFVLVNAAEFRDKDIESTLAITNIFYVMALMVVAPAVLGLINTLAINIMERKREIAIIRAIGSDEGQVQRVVIVEALMLGQVSAIVGILVGLVLGVGFVAIWQGAATNVGGGFYAIFPAQPILFSLVAGVLLTLLASMLPARSAARLDIVQSLQFE